MANDSVSPSLNHPAVLGLSRRRWVYAASVLSLSSLVVLLICLSVSVREFRSLQTIRIGPEDWGRVSLNDLREMSIAVFREATSNDSLQKVLMDWQARQPERVGISALNLHQIDCDQLRSRLSFGIDVSGEARELILGIGYSGRGNRAEQDFLRLFADQVSRRLAELGKLTPAQLNALRFDPTEFESSRRVRARQFADLREQLDGVEMRLTDLRNHLDQNWAGTGAEGSTPAGLVVNPQINRLKMLLSELLSQRDQLLGEHSGSHPDVVSVRQEIEQVNLQLQALQETAARSPANTFVQASFGNPGDPQSWNAFRQVVSGIDLAPLQSALSELETRDAESLDAWESKAKELTAALDAGPLMSVESAGGKLQALGAVTPSNVLWALLLATVFGSVVASRLDIWTLDRGFGNQQSAARELSLPVFTMRDEPESKVSQPALSASARLLKLGEIVLFTTLLVVAGMMLIDSEFRVAVMENPLHLFARLFWMVRV